MCCKGFQIQYKCVQDNLFHLCRLTLANQTNTALQLGSDKPHMSCETQFINL